MKYTLEALMQEVGCTKYPDRWAEIFDTVMEDFDQNGCPLTNSAYYDLLHIQYNAFPLHLETYKEAAVAVKKSEPLSRLLSLLVASLSDPENAWADVKSFSAPKTANGSPDLATDMLTGLAICCQIPYMYDLLTERCLPIDVILRSVQVLEKGVDQYALRHGGVPGYDLLEWFQRNIFGHLYRIHRLEIEIFVKFSGRARVFENSKGERIALAHDITLHRSGWALGARNCKEEEGSFYAEVRENDAVFAGELSGHYYFKQNYTAESQGLAMIMLANLICAKKLPLHTLIAPLKKYFSSGEINSKVADVQPILDAIKAKYTDGNMFELDGISVEYDNWWFNIRASNTEPLLRLIVEADTKELMESKKDELLKIIRG